MVTARNAEIDAVVGLEVGADDYVTKPFRLRELIARVRAALRRIPASEVRTTDPADVIEIGDVRLDTGRHEVFVRGESMAFPLKEFELLELLLTNAGRVLTRDVLIDRIWGPNYFGDTKTLDVHVKRLRSKIEIDPANPKRIVTVRGVGYRYERAAARPRRSRAVRAAWTGLVPVHACARCAQGVDGCDRRLRNCSASAGGPKIASNATIPATT